VGGRRAGRDESAHPPKATLDRLESIVKEKGMTVFARVDHAAGAAKVGKKLRPTELLIFGNPQGGTPLMECAQSAAIDLPMKAMAWEDAKGQSWIGYNDPAWIAKRHGAPKCAAANNLKKALAAFAEAAAAK
jgi:uncharacterized protein (DUF302 family)